MSRKPLTIANGAIEQLPSGAALDAGGWTLPTSGGTESDVLKADASGNAEWASLFLIVPISRNTTIFVSTSGNDTTGDGSAGSPYATLSKAAEHVAMWYSGVNTVTVYVGPGIYTSHPVVELESITGNRVSFQGDAPDENNVTEIYDVTNQTGGFSLTVIMDSVQNDGENYAADYYLTIKEATAGSGAWELIQGCHKITAVDTVNKRVTVDVITKATDRPSEAACTAKGYVHPAVINFSGQAFDASIVRGQFLHVNNLTLVGNNKSEHGIVVNSGYCALGNEDNSADSSAFVALVDFNRALNISDSGIVAWQCVFSDCTYGTYFLSSTVNVIYTYYTGIENWCFQLRSATSCDGRYLKMIGAGDTGLASGAGVVLESSSLIGHHMEALYNAGNGMFVNEMSNLNAVSLISSNNGRRGLSVLGMAIARLSNSEILNNGDSGIRAETGAYVSATSANVSGNGEKGIACHTAAKVECAGATVDNNTGQGLVAVTSGQVLASIMSSLSGNNSGGDQTYPTTLGSFQSDGSVVFKT